MKVMDALRQTGRTTRMLDKAILMARHSNKPVYVVLAHTGEIGTLSNLFDPTLCPRLNLIAYESAGELIDLDTLLPLDSSDGKIIFIDHGVIEHKFPHLVAVLHHYDKTVRFNLSDVETSIVNNNADKLNQTFTIKLK